MRAKSSKRKWNFSMHAQFLAGVLNVEPVQKPAPASLEPKPASKIFRRQKVVEQSVESIKAVGAATMSGAKAVGTATFDGVKAVGIGVKAIGAGAMSGGKIGANLTSPLSRRPYIAEAGAATVDGAKAVGTATVDGAAFVGQKSLEGAKVVGSATVNGAKATGALVATGLEKTGVTAGFQAVFGEGIDKSDAGLEAVFATVDTNHRGSIDAAEMRAYIRSVYAKGFDDKIVDDMMMAADAMIWLRNKEGEIGVEEFKLIMRAGPHKKSDGAIGKHVDVGVAATVGGVKAIGDGAVFIGTQSVEGIKAIGAATVDGAKAVGNGAKAVGTCLRFKGDADHKSDVLYGPFPLEPVHLESSPKSEPLVQKAMESSPKSEPLVMGVAQLPPPDEGGAISDDEPPPLE